MTQANTIKNQASIAPTDFDFFLKNIVYANPVCKEFYFYGKSPQQRIAIKPNSSLTIVQKLIKGYYPKEIAEQFERAFEQSMAVIVSHMPDQAEQFINANKIGEIDFDTVEADKSDEQRKLEARIKKVRKSVLREIFSQADSKVENFLKALIGEKGYDTLEDYKNINVKKYNPDLYAKFQDAGARTSFKNEILKDVLSWLSNNFSLALGHAYIDFVEQNSNAATNVGMASSLEDTKRSTRVIAAASYTNSPSRFAQFSKPTETPEAKRTPKKRSHTVVGVPVTPRTDSVVYTSPNAEDTNEFTPLVERENQPSCCPCM